jgi:hypothetical protein
MVPFLSIFKTFQPIIRGILSECYNKRQAVLYILILIAQLIHLFYQDRDLSMYVTGQQRMFAPLSHPTPFQSS